MAEGWRLVKEWQQEDGLMLNECQLRMPDFKDRNL